MLHNLILDIQDLQDRCEGGKMYTYYGANDNKKTYAMMVICIIIGVAIGASISSGRVITTNDTDRIEITAQITYTGTDADNLYYAITGNHFSDVGGVYDRCTKRTFDISNIEVNMLNYHIALGSGDPAQVYVLKENITDTQSFNILDQFQAASDLDGSIACLPGYDIIIMIFYSGVRSVTITGILHG